MKKEKEIGIINSSIKKCMKCILYKTRKNPVFGYGSIDAKIFFIGEAPGRSEDLQGLPFVGRAGRLFDELLQSIGLIREEVFISNILKCRPPKNRNPLKNEIEECKGYLEKQIRIIKPKIIVPLGNFASTFIFEKYDLKNDKISNIHGKVFKTFNNKNLIIIPLFHPAVAIYNPNKKSILINDFEVIKKYK
jgi:DNA polymerase